jgi:SAM-dependent methyltransferase
VIAHCKVCSSPDLYPVHPTALGGPWSRCLACGSDSSALTYADVRDTYDAAYVGRHLERFGPDGCEQEMTANLEWFQHYRTHTPQHSFLDVGCAEGAAIRGMRKRGWDSYGFDVIPEARTDPAVTIAPHFAADHLPRKYGALMAREVIEHVEGWRQFLVECRGALLLKGLCQIQTPRPWHEPHAIPYQPQHLQLFSPYALLHEFRVLGFSVLDWRVWDYGQGWLLQKADG